MSEFESTVKERKRLKKKKNQFRSLRLRNTCNSLKVENTKLSTIRRKPANNYTTFGFIILKSSFLKLST